MMTKQRVARVAAAIGMVMLGTALVPAVAHAAVVQQWVVVDASGNAVRGQGETAVLHFGPGEYQVTFARSVGNCAYVATVGSTGTTVLNLPINIAVGEGQNGPTTVLVLTQNASTGANVDAPFHLVTYCGSGHIDAVVNSGGQLERGSHVVSTTFLSSGSYAVDFDKNVSKCTFTAAIADNNTVGEITVASRPGDKNGVIVNAEFRDGTHEDTPFDLAVNCGAASMDAVVTSTGTTARASHVVSSKLIVLKGQSGRYQVVFDRNVAPCAFTATIGDPGSTPVSAPLTISTALYDDNTNAVFVFVHNVNGLTRNEPFHLNVTC